MPHGHFIVDDDNRFIIDTDSRAISNASGNRITLMQQDHKSERFTFELPRYIEGHDVRECDLIEIKYQNVGKGTSASVRPVMADKYIVEDIVVDPEDDTRAIFSWLLEENATWYAGTLAFQIKFACYEDPAAGTYSFKWHTDTFTSIDIVAGLNVEGALEEKYPSVLEQLTARLDYLYKNGTEHVHSGHLVLTDSGRIVQQGLDLCSNSRTMTILRDCENAEMVGFDNTLYPVKDDELVGRWVIIKDVMYYVGWNSAYNMTLYTDDTRASKAYITAPAGTVIYPADIDVTDDIKRTIGLSEIERIVSGNISLLGHAVNYGTLKFSASDFRIGGGYDDGYEENQKVTMTNAVTLGYTTHMYVKEGFTAIYHLLDENNNVEFNFEFSGGDLQFVHETDRFRLTIVKDTPEEVTSIEEYVNAVSYRTYFADQLANTLDEHTEDIRGLNSGFDYLTKSINKLDFTVNPPKFTTLTTCAEDVLDDGTVIDLGSTVEIGSTVDRVRCHWILSRKPAKVELDWFMQTPEREGTAYVAGGYDISLSEPGVKSWKIKAFYETLGDYIIETISITFANRIFYGVAAAPEEYTREFILGLANKPLRTSKLTSITVNAGSGQYVYYCLPKRLGTCIFSYGANEGGVSLVDTINFENESGYSEDYYIYRSDEPNLGNITLGVK